MPMRYYCRDRGALVYFVEEATPAFWDKHWEVAHLRGIITGSGGFPLFTRCLRRFLPGEKGIILEGGCGLGALVYTLKGLGYRGVGVDFAPQTMRRVKEAVPELDIVLADVRRLPFSDGGVAGYYSLGVIEHFREGYDAIVSEMTRVLRPGGYGFLAFPYMSPLRRLKAFLGLYPRLAERDWQGFYQFALDVRGVARSLGKHGLACREAHPFDGIKGLKDEVALLRRPLQRLYDYHGRSRVALQVRRCLDRMLQPWAGHCILLVLQKKP